MPLSPRLLRPRSAAIAGDSDVQNYIAAVEIADGQQLEQAVKDAIRDFILGCKTDGIWSAIRASCILMGARTLSGALTPLVGTAPTNNNFVTGDYSRGGSVPGLKSNASNKWLNSNRANNADGQNDCHAYVHATQAPGVGSSMFGTSWYPSNGRYMAWWVPATGYYHSANSAAVTSSGTVTATSGLGGWGVSRSSSSSYTSRAGSFSATHSINSTTPAATNLGIFSSSPTSAGTAPCDARLSFYSIGSAVDLSLLGTRVAALQSAIGAAIP